MFHRSTYVFLPEPRVLTTATVSNIVKSASGGFKQKHNDTSWQSITLSQGEHKVRDKRYQVRQQGSSEQGAGIRLAKIAQILTTSPKGSQECSGGLKVKSKRESGLTAGFGLSLRMGRQAINCDGDGCGWETGGSAFQTSGVR